MELAPEEEMVISMHMDIFRKNGFSMVEDNQAPCGRCFVLKAVPFSKNVTFWVADIKDLISILSDNQGDCSMIGSYRSDMADSVPPNIKKRSQNKCWQRELRDRAATDLHEARTRVNY